MKEILTRQEGAALFRAHAATLGPTQVAQAKVLGVDPRSMARFANGSVPIPAPVCKRLGLVRVLGEVPAWGGVQKQRNRLVLGYRRVE